MTKTAQAVAQYEAQGYALPAGLSVSDVEAYQVKWDIDPIFMPLVSVSFAAAHGNSAAGVTAWGVPFIDGKPLAHD